MTKPIPDGFHTITPHIVVQDAAKAIEFYKQAFGAAETVRHLKPDGKAVMHAELKIGDSMVMLGNEFPPKCLSPKARGGTSTVLHLYVENADAAFERAVKAGCTVKMPSEVTKVESTPTGRSKSSAGAAGATANPRVLPPSQDGPGWTWT